MGGSVRYVELGELMVVKILLRRERYASKLKTPDHITEKSVLVL